MTVQKWSKCGVFCAFGLRNVLRATTACTFDFETCFAPQRRELFHAFSTSQLPKVVWTWCFLQFDVEMCFAPQRRAILEFSSAQMGSAPAALASLLFDPPEPQNVGKHSVSRLFTFSCTWIFFLLALSLLWYPFFFSSLLFSDSSHLYFFICPYCRKFDV